MPPICHCSGSRQTWLLIYVPFLLASENFFLLVDPVSSCFSPLSSWDVPSEPHPCSAGGKEGCLFLAVGCGCFVDMDLPGWTMCLLLTSTLFPECAPFTGCLPGIERLWRLAWILWHQALPHRHALCETIYSTFVTSCEKGRILLRLMLSKHCFCLI